MTNAEIARLFGRIALILDLKGGENPFRIRAYERAAMMIENLGKNLSDIHAEGGVAALRELPGIGEDLASKIDEMVRTGGLRYLRAIEKSVPPGLLQILEIEGMGPKKTKFVWKTFKVKSIAELGKLARSGKLETLKGWGKKSVENILRGIDQRSKMSGRLPLHAAAEIAEEILRALRATGLCDDLAIAGSLRRGRETVGDIDILATGRRAETIMDCFCALPQVDRVTSRGPTKATVFLKAGLDCDLRVVDRDVFGAALHYFTGSMDHNVHIRRMALAKGYTINEYGVHRGTAKNKGRLVAARTEEDVYRVVGLPYIEPELREDRGEIEAGQQKKLPALITAEDLRGDLHLHSDWSDGTDSIAAMAKAAKDRGLAYIAVTDHASVMGMVGGIKTGNLKKYLDAVAAARKKVPGIRILAGAEVDILEDGRLYLPDSALAKLDWVVASVHQHFRQPRDVATERLLRVARHPLVDLIGHPTTRMVGKRPGIELDLESVMKEAAKHGTAMEISASPERLDLSDVHARRARELGVPLCIDSDAHGVNGLDCRYGITQARRAWIGKKDVLNALPWEKFRKVAGLR